jgi:hypothetical protein
MTATTRLHRLNPAKPSIPEALESQLDAVLANLPAPRLS